MKRRILQVQRPTQLRALLSEELGLQSEELATLLGNGAVYVRGRRCRDPGAELDVGSSVTVVLEESGRSTRQQPKAAPQEPAVLFEDEWLLVVNKPPGAPTQPTPGGAEESVLSWAGRRLSRLPGLVHRLDRETSGVLVFGKLPKATSHLAAQFREGTSKKRYLAVVEPGLPHKGLIDLPISKDPSRPGRYRATLRAHGVKAVTVYRVLGQGQGVCLVALFPRTGRTHQLRAHLTALDHPILGDLRYGGAPRAGALEAGRCLLHAHGLWIRHPRDESPMALLAPILPDLEPFVRATVAQLTEDFE
jgi:23S rRNA pseudouridine1911/1915/1917 synthase